jgi:HEAT repeat protein
MVALAAVDALGSIGSARALDPLKSLLTAADPALKRHVVSAIGSLKSADVDSYLKTWLADDDAYLRGFSAEALSRRPRREDLEADLIGRLSDPVLAVQIRSAETLGAWKSRAAVPALITALRSSEPTLRWKAVLALGAIGDASASEPLDYIKGHDVEEDIRKAAAEALKGLK